MSGEARSRAKDGPQAPRTAPAASGNAAQEPVKWSAANWLTFLLERAPPAVFLLLATGPCLSGLHMVQGYVDWERAGWAVGGMLTLLLMIRVMDDVKDFEKDKIVHPDRPLPRGLISYDEVVRVIQLTFLALCGYTVLLALRFNTEVGSMFALQLGYTYLMYVEFGAGEWLEERPFLYGLVHQISIYFSAMFICSLGGASPNSQVGLLMGSVAFSGFFTYEICRKLDPTLPKLKGTYRVVYGKWLTLLFVCATVAVGVVSSYLVGLHWMLWPLQALMIAAMLVLTLLPVRGPKPRAHKLVEALSVLYLLLHMWSGYIASFF